LVIEINKNEKELVDTAKAIELLQKIKTNTF
jgi:hypothetical protein